MYILKMWSRRSEGKDINRVKVWHGIYSTHIKTEKNQKNSKTFRYDTQEHQLHSEEQSKEDNEQRNEHRPYDIPERIYATVQKRYSKITR